MSGDLLDLLEGGRREGGPSSHLFSLAFLGGTGSNNKEGQISYVLAQRGRLCPSGTWSYTVLGDSLEPWEPAWNQPGPPQRGLKD